MIEEQSLSLMHSSDTWHEADACLGGRHMPLELANLRAVLTAARLGSFSRAAEALNITQPALSRGIAEAESALEVQLFERRPRGVQATEACLAFIGHAETALNSIENGREAVRETENLRLSEAT